MIDILFNYDGDITEVSNNFNVKFVAIPEMIDGSYFCSLKKADDFDVLDDFMSENGVIEVISGFYRNNGLKYKSKKSKNRFNVNKYKNYLRDRFDKDGNKLTKELWQVNKYSGSIDRELEE